LAAIVEGISATHHRDAIGRLIAAAAKAGRANAKKRQDRYACRMEKRRRQKRRQCPCQVALYSVLFVFVASLHWRSVTGRLQFQKTTDQCWNADPSFTEMRVCLSDAQCGIEIPTNSGEWGPTDETQCT
jgi:hypothetical protein